jgi:HEAT repeats
MARLAWCIAVLIGLAFPLALVAKAAERDAEQLTIRVDGDMLTVKARQVPHRRILERLAKQLNFELIIAGPLDDRRSLEIEGRPWEETLKRVLAPASWAFVYHASGNQPQLAKVFVFPSKGGSSNANPPTSPGRVVSPPPTLARTTKPQAAASPKSEPAATDPSLAHMVESDDEEMRALALVGLATMGGEQAIAAITRALQDRQPWIRETAVEALAEVGGEQAIRGLQQALNDENAEVQKAALEALRRLQSNTP